MTQPTASQSGTSVLIVDCPACVDPSRANVDGRQADGFREWTAEFEPTTSTNGEGWCWWPVAGIKALNCPECGERGRIWSY